MFEASAMIQPDTEYLVVFRGGQGGNFLSVVLNSALDKEISTASAYIGNNEYYNTESRPVTNSHINLWFRQYRGQPYGTEIYTVGAYRKILNFFKERNIKLIILNIEYPLILATELLGVVKSRSNMGKIDQPYNKEKTYKMLRGYQDPEKQKFYTGIIRHYHTLSKIASAYNIPHIAVDYRDIFLNQHIDNLVEFLNIPSNNVDQLRDTIEDYTNKNKIMLAKLGIEFPVTTNA